MRGLHTLSWRTLRARPLRTALTTLGVALGVAVLTASLATSAGIDGAIDRTVADVVGRADLRISAFLEAGLSAATLEAIRATDGVAVAAPAVERRTFLEPPLGHGPFDPVTVLGIDPAVDARVHDLTLVAGAPLAGPGELVALVTERLAATDGYVLGGQLTIQGAGAPTTVRVVGIIAGSGPFVGSGGRAIVVPIDVAQAAFGLDGVSRVDVVLDPGTAVEPVLADLEARLTSEPYVASSPRDLAASLRASTIDVQSTTALVAVIALFVGAFLIFNTLSMTVTERAREVGLLRAAGATRSQVVTFVLSGAVALGGAGSFVGVLGGILLARVMAIYVGGLRGFPAEPLAPGAGPTVAAFLVGVLVTVAAALEPAIRASAIVPVEALRARLDLASTRRARLRWLVVVFLIVAVVGLLAWPSGVASGGAGRALVVYAALLIATLASPFVVPLLARLAGLPFRAGARLEERLARGSLGRDRSRTALTLGALTVGLAMVVALGWSAQAAKAAASAWLADVIPGDEVVTSIRPVAPEEGVAEALAAVPGVVRVTPVATFDIAARGIRLDAAAVAGADLAADGRLRIIAGDRSSALAALDAGGSVIVASSTAERLGVAVGDSIAVALADGSRADLRVAAIAERSIPGRGGEAMLLGWADAERLYGVTGADFFAIRFDPASLATARPALEAAARGLALEPNPLERVQGAVTDALGRVYGLFDAIALVAVLVAALGIVNTLTMSVVERVRELGVLRAIGMSRRQASRMVIVEAGVLGVVGAILGIATGLAVGLLLLLLGDVTLATAGIPWVSIAVAAVLGIAVSIAAAWWPARAASRVSIIQALAFE
jgi:putative ABC transport system permease protein